LRTGESWKDSVEAAKKLIEHLRLLLKGALEAEDQKVGFEK